MPPLSAVLSATFSIPADTRLPLLKYRILVGSFADLALPSRDSLSSIRRGIPYQCRLFIY